MVDLEARRLMPATVVLRLRRGRTTTWGAHDHEAVTARPGVTWRSSWAGAGGSSVEYSWRLRSRVSGGRENTSEQLWNNHGFRRKERSKQAMAMLWPGHSNLYSGQRRQIKYFWIFLRPQIMGVIKIVTELIRKDFAKYMTTIFKIPQNLLVELELVVGIWSFRPIENIEEPQWVWPASQCTAETL